MRRLEETEKISSPSAKKTILNIMSILSENILFYLFRFCYVYLSPILSVIFNIDWHPANAEIHKTLVYHE